MIRRQFLLAAAGLPLTGLVLASAGRLAEAQATPPCGAATPRQTEGPYFTPRSPLKRDLREPGMAGETLRLEGSVLDPRCRPLAGAKVEIWQADADGAYDNAGFRLRGHVMANADGVWRVDTVRPGLYPGRTRHLHVKVYATPTARPLTTQLYFPNEPGNARDEFYDQRLLLSLRQAPAGQLGQYNFVLGG